MFVIILAPEGIHSTVLDQTLKVFNLLHRIHYGQTVNIFFFIFVLFFSP